MVRLLVVHLGRTGAPGPGRHRPRLAATGGRYPVRAEQIAGWTRIAAILLALYFVGFIAFAVMAERGLTADGAADFIIILWIRRVYSSEASRWATNLLTQWPLLGALRLGLTDLPTLSRLYGFGLFYLTLATPIMSWFLLPANGKRLIVLPVMTIIFGFMASCYDAVSQGQALAMWFWPTAFALATRDLKTPGGAAIVLLLSAPTILMHEGMCLLGPLLAAIALVRARREAGPAWQGAWILVALWMLAGAVVGLYYTLHPIHADNRQDFINGMTRLLFLLDDATPWNPPVIVSRRQARWR